MPELPEVETVVLALRPHVVGQVICAVSSYPGHERVFEHVNFPVFQKILNGNKIKRITRRGKYILLDVEEGFMAVHLRMTGVLKTSLSEIDNPKHLAFRLDFENRSSLYFKDYRKFGRVYFYRTIEEMDSFLGVEPLSDAFTVGYLKRTLQDRNRMIKPFLLDQKFIAGLGNIYVDEALWSSKIHPKALSSEVPLENINNLHGAIKTVLEKALSFRGTTFMSFSFEGENRGEFKRYLNVFGRDGQPCNRCGNVIIKIKVGQRGTHLCPVCQKNS